MNLPTLLKEKRTKKGLTQHELSKEVNELLEAAGVDLISQATISAWESGRQTPSFSKEEQLKTIAEILDISEIELQNLWGGVFRKKATPDEIYVSNVTNWVDGYFKKKTPSSKGPVIWFIAPDQLPATSNEGAALKSLWALNLGKGVDYKFLWVVDELKSLDLLKHFYELLDEIDDQLVRSEANGKVFNYIISYDGLGCDMLSVKLFEMLKAKWEGGEGHHSFDAEWKVMVSDHDDSWQPFLDQLKRFHVFLSSRVTFYESPDERYESQATIHFNNTSANMFENPKSCYRWLKNEDLKIIMSMLQEFNDLLTVVDFDLKVE